LLFATFYQLGAQESIVRRSIQLRKQCWSTQYYAWLYTARGKSLLQLTKHCN